MSKLKIRALFGLILIGGFSFTLVQAQVDECQLVRDDQSRYLESQVQLEEDLYSLMLVSAQDMDTVHSQLMKHLGKSLGDISQEVRRIQLIAGSLSEKGDAAYDQADADDEKAYEWIEKYPGCQASSQLQALEEWQLINYENLETIASFIGGYANLMSAWPAQWEKLREEGDSIDEESFAQVEEVRKGLEESVELMSDTFEYTKEAFEAARLK